MLKLKVAGGAILLIATLPAAVLGFQTPGQWVSPRARAGSAFSGQCLHALRRLRGTARPATVKMMADEDEWFNPGAVAKLARSAPAIPKRPPTISAPAPFLLEGVLEWGYYAGMSWEGRGKGTQVGGINNQDSIIASSLDNSILFGVFDGHGEYGGEASQFLTETLPTNVYEVEADIDAAGMDSGKSQPFFQAAYAKTHQALLEQTDFDTFLSGSTCITVLVGLSPSLPRTTPEPPMLLDCAFRRSSLSRQDLWSWSSATSEVMVERKEDK